MTQVESVLARRAQASGLVEAADLTRCRAELGNDADDKRVLEWLVKHGLLTKWQAAQLEAGRTQNLILAHYKLLSPLGAGGMGSVYRALDTKLARQVALKVLPPRQATPDAISRFRREAFVALQMRHDNVVTGFELAQQGTIHFLVMELVDGRSLSAHLVKEGRLGVRETARIGRDVALALAHAHEQGIIHRDIKPSNILLSREGHVKVADMGLAKFFGPQSRDGGPETRTGQFMGTIDYCSPEQAVDAKRADIRSDIYSLGCTLYHCLTAEPPFAEGTEVQRIMAHIDLLPSSIRVKNHDVPPALAELIEKRMLAKDPGYRFQTPAEAAEALAPWIEGEGADVNPWAGLAGLEGLLEVAAQAPRVDVPGAPPRSHRDTARRPKSPITRHAVKLPLGAKDESILRGPLGWAALVVVVLAGATAASLWWPRHKPEQVVAQDVVAANIEGQNTAEAPSVAGVTASGAQADPPDGNEQRPDKQSLSDETNKLSAVSPPKPLEVADADRAGTLSTPEASPSVAAEAIENVPAAPKPPGLMTTVKHGTSSVYAVGVSADGTTLITGGEDKTARIWNAADGTPRGAPLTHEEPVGTVGLSADGRFAITGQDMHGLPLGLVGKSRAGKVPLFVEGRGSQTSRSRFSLWNLSAPETDASKPLLPSRGPQGFGADGKDVLALDWDAASGTAWCGSFGLATGGLHTTRLLPPKLTVNVVHALFSPDLQRLAACANAPWSSKGIELGTLASEVWFWDTNSGRIAGNPKRLADHSYLYTACFRPDGRVLAVVIDTWWTVGNTKRLKHSNPRVQLLDVPNGRMLKEFPLPQRPRRIAFNPRGDLLAVVAPSNLELRDAETGELRGPRTAIAGAWSVAFSGDGDRLFVGKSGGTAELWEVDSLLSTPQAPSEPGPMVQPAEKKGAAQLQED